MLTIGTTTTISFLPSEVVFGGGYGNQQVNIIPDGPALASPSGDVTLYSGSTVLQTIPIQPGQYTVYFYASSFTPGSYSLRAVYSGDSNFAPSGSSVYPLTVDKGDLFIAATSGPVFTTFGTPTTLGAYFAPGVPGAVRFYASYPSGLIDLGVGVNVSSGSYQLTTSDLHGGNGTYYAVSAETTDYDSATTQPPDELVVAQAVTSTSLNLTSLPSPTGEEVAKLTANVSSPVNSPILPTGSVTFTNGSTVLGSAPLSGGMASFTATLPVGIDHLTATYSSDTNYQASTSTVLTQVVGSPTMRYVNQVYVDVLGRPADIPSLLYWTGQLAKGESRQKFVSTLVLSPEGRAAEVQTEYEHYLNRLATPSQLKSATASPFSLVTLDTQIVGGVEYYINVGQLVPDYLAAIGPAVLGRPLPSSYYIQYATELDSYQPRYKVASQLLNSEAGHIARVEGYYENVFGRPADASGLSYYVGLLNKGIAPEQVWIDLLSSSEFYDSFTT